MSKQSLKISARRFTLIEMLVVIAIIGILAAMMSPALRRALAQAHSATCANNLKQSFVAMTMYADASNDYYPAPNYLKTPSDADCKFGAGVTLNWAQAILYADGKYPVTNSSADINVRKNHAVYEAFSCPAAPVFPKRTSGEWQNDPWNQVFGMNPFLMKGWGQTDYYGSVSGTYVPVPRARAPRKRTNLDWYKPGKPSRTALLMDSATEWHADGNPAWAMQYHYVGASHGDIFLRHSEKANICALDGSVRGCPMVNLCLEYNITSYADADGSHTPPGKTQK